MHGRPTPKQLETIARYVKDRSVLDLGAGSGGLSEQLAEMGAHKVVAIDKEPPGFLTLVHPAIYAVTGYFDALSDLVSDVAFVSWPINQPQSGLSRILRNAKTVIYLGKNTDGAACGHPDMFEDFLRRQLLEYIPDRTNTLIVLGGSTSPPRKPKGEEWAGIRMFDEKPMTFEEAESR